MSAFLKNLFVSTQPQQNSSSSRISTPSSASESERRRQRKMSLLSKQREKNNAKRHAHNKSFHHHHQSNTHCQDSNPPSIQDQQQYYSLGAPISSAQYATKSKNKHSSGVKIYRGAAYQLPQQASTETAEDTTTSSSSSSGLSSRTSTDLSPTIAPEVTSSKNILSRVRVRASSNAETSNLHFTATTIHQSSTSKAFSKKWKKTHLKPSVVKHHSTSSNGRLRALSLTKRNQKHHSSSSTTSPSTSSERIHSGEASNVTEMLKSIFQPIGSTLSISPLSSLGMSHGAEDASPDEGTLSPSQRHRNHSNLNLNDEASISELRREKFVHLLEEQHTNVPALRKLSWNGIPKSMRGEVWKIVIGYLPRSQARRDKFLHSKRAEYLDLVDKYYFDKTMGKTEEEQNILHQIHIDVPRTNPEVPLFQNQSIQEALERILYIWSIRHASGYVQGLNDLVTPFLVVYLHAVKPVPNLMESDIDSLISKEEFETVEADTFFSFSLFLDMIQDHYSFGQPGIQRMVQKLEDIIEKIDKPLFNHFQDLNLNFLQFSFRWMNCVLMRELSIKQIIRLFDAFLSESNDKQSTSFETLHVYVCAAFLKNWSAQLMELDFTELVIFLQHLPTQEWGFEEIDLLLSQAYMLKELFETS